MSSQFIENLQRKRSNYSHPDQATSQANSLVLLSSGIYTEEERFIFELLQNAVDAHDNLNGILDIKILLKYDYLIFMHNGTAFSERDIEGLCDVGNGNKMKDATKIGYKGIGFKSVFMRSTDVTVMSGGYCFKFNKEFWSDYWEKCWKTTEYGERDMEKKYAMPWQIIPIEACPPVELTTDGYNVVTYIKLTHLSSIEKKILNLFSNSQFLLFLKADNIKMSFLVDGNERVTIEKSRVNGQVVLSSNGSEDSRWLIYCNDKVEVPENLRNLINADINTPDKLKDAKTFDLSFAVALGKNNKLKRLEKDESVIFTYLPTSYRFGNEGFPFLVNANFITDAGRQQLHKDSEWNKLIFSKIPSEFLTWMKNLSTVYDNYWEVLPEKSYGSANPLESIYEDMMKEAIAKIAFIPRKDDASTKILASDAYMDRMGVSSAISSAALAGHINRTYERTFNVTDQIATVWKGSRILANYGVFIFDKRKINGLFDDVEVFADLTTDLDIKLVDYLYEYYQQNQAEQDELVSILRKTRFLLDETLQLHTPDELFYPSSYKQQNALAEGTHIMHGDIYDAFKTKNNRITWLSTLGVETLSDITFVENVVCRDGYITSENVIEVGRFLFSIYQKEDLFGKVSSYKLKYIQFLTKKGSLKFIKNLYLSAEYKPELNLESTLDEDIFISEKYCEGASAAEWKVFLLKMGAQEDVTQIEDTVELYGDVYANRYDKPFFDEVKNHAQKYGWISYEGWSLKSGYSFGASEVNVDTFTYLSHCDDYQFSKLVFSSILSRFSPDEIKTKVTSVSGATGYFSRTVYPSMLAEVGCKINHFKWVIESCSVIPTTKQDCRKSSEVFSNGIPNINEMVGKYLPVIDVECTVSESWQQYLGLKTYLSLDDYLYLLSAFAADPESAVDNKSKISLVYQKMVELGCLESEYYRTQIKNWAASNSILSQKNMFVSPDELSYITLDGFSSNNRVYIGNSISNEKIVELLALMGVKVITSDSISAEFDSKSESTELKNILVAKHSALALLASGEDADEVMYSENRLKLRNLIDDTCFYHCDRIKLTYGDLNDVIEKHTFGSQNEFYYTGDLRPANVEPLLTPLCRYLNLGGKERELFIMFIETIDGIKQNLKDKGYNVDLIQEDVVPDSGTLNVKLDYHPDISDQERNLITGFKGEILIYEKLVSLGYNPQCLSISTSDDYTNQVDMNGKQYFCKPNYQKYDIRFRSHSGKEVFVEVKSTTKNKYEQENMPISYRELAMVEECNDNSDKIYLIVRVFGIDQTSQDIYIFNGHLWDNDSILRSEVE